MDYINLCPLNAQENDTISSYSSTKKYYFKIFMKTIVPKWKLASEDSTLRNQEGGTSSLHPPHLIQSSQWALPAQGQGRWTPALTEQTGMVQVRPAATWDPRLSRLCEHKAASCRGTSENLCVTRSFCWNRKKKMQEGNTNSFKASISPYRQHHKSLNSSLWILPLHSGIDLIPKQYSLPNLKIRA